MERDNEKGERLASLESEVRFIKDLLLTMNNKLDNYNEVFIPRKEIDEKFAVRDKRLDNENDRIKKLEDNQTWLWRTVVGSIITGAIGIFIYLIKNGGV